MSRYNRFFRAKSIPPCGLKFHKIRWFLQKSIPRERLTGIFDPPTNWTETGDGVSRSAAKKTKF
jgi:hypothetical protein